ncbi:MAG: CynX/NimT family MFS transporter [Microbacteriaceae bacterium]
MSSPASAPLWAGRSVALLGILTVAMSLRSAISAISPIIEQISVDVALSNLALGVIGGMPAIIFAASGLIAPRLAHRVGLEAGIIVAVVLMTAGHLVRAFSDSVVALFLGTAVTLLGMGLGNVLLPPAVKRYFPDRVGLLTSMYAVVLSISASTPPLIAAPLADSVGWRVSLGVWAGVAIIGVIPWVQLWLRRRTALAAQAHEAALRRAKILHENSLREEHLHDDAPEIADPQPTLVAAMWRSPVALGMTLAFAVSSLNVYAMFAWLPSILLDSTGATASEAGTYLALYAVMGIPAGIAAPFLLRKLPSHGWSIYVGVAFFVIGYAGLAIAPATLTWLWVVCAGLGPMWFPLCLVLIGVRSQTQESAVALSGFMQGIGYTIGATGPFALGLAHDALQSWTVPVCVLLATTLLGIIAGRLISKPGTVDEQLSNRPEI